MNLFEYVHKNQDKNLTWDLALNCKCPSHYGYSDLCEENEFGSEYLCAKCWSRLK
jgi:predicted SprT family Zn-dependent metalloprotease